MEDKKFKMYARAVIWNSDKSKVLLLKKNNDQKIGAGSWMLPGGTLEWGEEIENTLVREIKEETNLDVSSLILVTTRKMILGNTHWLGLYYEGSVVNEGSLTNVEANKHEKVDFTPLDLLPQFSDYSMMLFVANMGSNKEYVHVPSILSDAHSMNNYLKEYVSIKMHHVFTDYVDKISSVKIVPVYDRSVLVSKKEKNNKIFNFKRPTLFFDQGIMYLACFPGSQYVEHYAKLVRSYFDSLGKETIQVSYFLPSETQTKEAVVKSIPDTMPQVDTVIFGNVDKLNVSDLGPYIKNGEISYSIYEKNGKRIMFIGCEYSVWGNTTKTFIEVIKSKTNCNTFVYVGKVGALRTGIIPNENVAVIDEACIRNSCYKLNNIWKNLPSNFILGNHISLPSVMDETLDFVEKYKEKFSFVDPEIGEMAEACENLSIHFLQLHIVSDSVVNMTSENLSNERRVEIIEKRNKLWAQISEVLLQLVE